MLEAELKAAYSKDQSTQVGAVIVNPHSNTIISSGWNGIPRGVDDTLAERSERPEKYLWYSHAEENAIANAAANGHATAGCTLYVTHMPCPSCARKIIGARLLDIIVPEYRFSEDDDLAARHKIDRSVAMFREAGVSLRPVPREFSITINQY